MPGLQLGNIQLPNIQLPNVQLPNIQLPNVQLPDFQLPNIQLGQLDLPNAGPLSTTTKEAINIARVLPMIFSIALHGNSDYTEICKQYAEDGSEIVVDLKPIVNFIQIDAHDEQRDYRDDHEKIYYDDDDDEMMKKLAGFKPNWPTKLIAHGFQNKWPAEQYSWEDNIMNQLPLIADQNGNRGYNIFVVSYDHSDETTANLAKSYARMAATIPVLAQYVGRFLLRLKQLIPAVNFSNFHLIGHSLGAHLVGLAGNHLRKHSDNKLKVGYITGIDPAGPCFEENDADSRLDLQDAIRVEAIHSNKGGFGIVRPVGHIDIQLNNGINQPGAYNAVASHKKSIVQLFYSDQGSCDYLAYRCDNYDQYQQGDCAPCESKQDDQNCLLFKHWPYHNQPNEESLTANRNIWIKEPTTYHNYYTSTSDMEPFCQHIAQVDIRSSWMLPGDVANLKLESDGKRWLKHITISRSTREPVTVDEYTGKVYHHYTGLLEVQGDYGTVTSATLFTSFERPQDVPSDEKLQIHIDIDYRSNSSFKQRRALSTKLCLAEFTKNYALFGLNCPI